MRWLTSLSKLIVFAALLLTSCTRATTLPFDYYANYCVVDGTDSKQDARWADYLARHLEKRCLSPTLVSRNFTQADNHVKLSVHIEPALTTDWALYRHRQEIRLSARTEEVMLWLIYQFIAGVAEADGRFQARDLPPASIPLETGEGTWAFELRSIYSPTNADPDLLPIRATHHVDYDWALWGHNLRKVVGEKPAPELQALVDGKRTAEQFCFSAPALYDQLEAWVLDQHGAGTREQGERFMVLPQDNALVCQCDLCRKAGNTPHNATPSVALLLRRLARRFPCHRFFTAAYGTTEAAPVEPLPANAGVFLSAMSLPLQAKPEGTEGLARLEDLLAQWKPVCPRIYVWDYVQNYDDYLTPYPYLTALQARLRLYRRLGVRGVFLNGSGETYSTFDGVHTFVAAALLLDPDTEVEPLVRRYFQWRYPHTHEQLSGYYLGLERRVADSNRPLPLYGGIGLAAKDYLEAAEFETFWRTLDSASKQVPAEERQTLGRLLTALCFTRLELQRLAGNPDSGQPTREAALEVLRDYASVPGLEHYRETMGSMADYLREWDEEPLRAPSGNRLQGVGVEVAPLDEEAPAPDVLTDGSMGFPSDYHTGWLVSGAREWRFTLRKAPAAEGTLRLSLLLCKRWRMGLPRRVSVEQGGRTLCSLEPPAVTADTLPVRHWVDLPLRGLQAGQRLALTLQAPEGDRPSLACDEILFLPANP